MVTAIIAFLSAFIGGKVLLWSEKKGWKTMISDMVEDQKDGLFDWLKSEDGMTTLASVGKLVGVGFTSTLKVPKGTGGGTMKIFGYKVPAQLIWGFAEKMGWIPKISPEMASSEERLKSVYE